LNRWTYIRAEARRLHQQLSPNEPATGVRSGVFSAGELLARAEAFTGVTRVPVPADDPLLYGSLAVLSGDYIWYNADVESWFALYCQAHEYAHHWLHHGQTHCSRSDIEGAASEDVSPVGEGRITGYGPHELREREANVFAREFLMPGDLLRRWFVEGGLKASAIADRVGLPVELVCHQLARALLVPDAENVENDPAFEQSEKESSKRREDEDQPFSGLALDESQRLAACASRGPLLIEAGPGTGKTRTLIGRVLYLLKGGVSPENILVLTFSNKAAQELQERVAHFAPEAKSGVWTGTFHAFGLEILRKYWAQAGLPPKPKLLDPIDALFMLERALPELRLDHYQNLSEPTRYLKDILAAISRAKDELASPADYCEKAERMRAGAQTPEEVERAERALEVGRIYDFYQDYLERERLLDFGDLIFKAVRLLRENQSVRAEVRMRHREILVDEYQDVNRASGLLLREVCGDGRGLWAVGDIRQSVYRWRGASTANMRLFEKDFPGAKFYSLKINYRSQPAILKTFSALAPQMKAVRQPGVHVEWAAHRPDQGCQVIFEITESRETEAEFLAAEVRKQQRRGIPLSRQAVICRSHNNLAHFAMALENAGVPILYLGDIFERHEGRDLLSLMELSCEGRGRALLRVGRFPEYKIPFKDIRKLIAIARREECPFPAALKLARGSDDISEAGQKGLALLNAHVEGLCEGSSAWKFLSLYLFVRSNYLRLVLQDDSIAGQQRRLALYQFLQFTYNQLNTSWFVGADPKLALLKYVRRLEMFGEEKNYRQLPEWAEKIEAVRLLTIHASKGLEFRAVYLPYLGARYMPHQRQPQHCPPPDGLIEGYADEKEEHLEEEECLFFVALSRAQDLLCLSRAQVYGRQKSNASKFLELIEPCLQRKANGPVSWTPPPDRQAAEAGAKGVEAFPVETRFVPPRYTERQLEAYMRCPRQYLYEHVLFLDGGRDDSAFLQFHSCVYSAIGWMQQEKRAGRLTEESAARARLLELWDEKGPKGHAYEGIYFEQAQTMISRAFGRLKSSAGDFLQPEWELNLSNGRVLVRPDHIELIEEGEKLHVIVHKLKTGRPSEGEKKKEIYGLLHAAARMNYAQAERRVRTVYLSTGVADDVELTEKQIAGHLRKYEEAIDGIQRSDFPPLPDAFKCPTCPHYFICPSAEE